MTTFEQFQATRKPCDDLGAAISESLWEGEPAATGNLYLGTLYIERVAPHWPFEARAQGAWHLCLENCEWISDDLESLERRLYEWSQSAGYCDKPGRLVLDSQVRHAAEMPDLDDACRHIQNLLEVMDGGLAGQFFSDFEWDAEPLVSRMDKLRDYITIECGARAISTPSKLVEHFVPIVREFVTPFVDEINARRAGRKDRKPIAAEVGVAFVEFMPGGAKLYNVEIAIAGRLRTHEMFGIVEALQNEFGCYESAPLSYDSLEFRLGDGDDDDAVQFVDGKICIWLRGFTPEVAS